MEREPVEREVAALEAGRAVLDLDGWSMTTVAGPDAEAWLHDLVTASVEDLPPGVAVRSLLLSPTGRVRADFHVVRSPGGFALLQPPGQPSALADLLEPYVLSSDVTVAADPGPRPLVMPAMGPEWRATFGEPGPESEWTVSSPAAFEAWRIRAGIPRFPVDLDEDSLAAEGGLDVEPVIDREKGCYLGQEAVARVRNLGHPPRVIVAVRAGTRLRAGAGVVAAGAPTGVVTSVDAVDGASAALVRVRWAARDQELSTEDGIRLTRTATGG